MRKRPLTPARTLRTTRPPIFILSADDLGHRLVAIDLSINDLATQTASSISELAATLQTLFPALADALAAHTRELPLVSIPHDTTNIRD